MIHFDELVKMVIHFDEQVNKDMVYSDRTQPEATVHFISRTKVYVCVRAYVRVRVFLISLQ